MDVTFFQEPISQDSLVRTLETFEILVLMRERTRFPRAVLEALPTLRLLVMTGMRNAAVDIACLQERGVVVSGTAGSSGTLAARPGSGPCTARS